MKQIKSSWKDFWENKTLRWTLIFSLLTLVGLIWFFSRFVIYVEYRQGVVLNDPVLNLFAPLNLTWLTFVIIYSAVILTIIHLLNEPVMILIGVQSYILVLAFRILSMYLLPLDPPALMIPLIDPIVEILGSTGKTLTKDLFFSGHTATMFLFFLLSSGLIKKILLLLTIIVALCVMLQHVHYSIDVFVAFFVVYTSFSMIKRLNKKFN